MDKIQNEYALHQRDSAGGLVRRENGRRKTERGFGHVRKKDDGHIDRMLWKELPGKTKRGKA